MACGEPQRMRPVMARWFAGRWDASADQQHELPAYMTVLADAVRLRDLSEWERLRDRQREAPGLDQLADLGDRATGIRPAAERHPVFLRATEVGDRDDVLRATRKLDEPLAVSDRLGVLARAERDLWMLDDRSADAFQAYEAVTETRISHTAVSFYRLAWSLSDIASFLTMFRTTSRQTQWLDQKWTGFLHLLGGAQSTPYC